MRIATDEEVEKAQESDGYVDYIMDHCGGDRVICNGDTLISAVEDGYLFEDYLETLGLYTE